MRTWPPSREQNARHESGPHLHVLFDIYLTRDLANGTLTEQGAQELMDDFVMKLRMARHLRTPEYNELFGGDPMWITESVGGMASDGRTLVTKNSYRVLNTLYTLGSFRRTEFDGALVRKIAQCPFKRFCAKVSIDTDSIQYENDDRMRPIYGDDYAIARCVSAMRVGKQMQFFWRAVTWPSCCCSRSTAVTIRPAAYTSARRCRLMDDAVPPMTSVMERFAIYRSFLLSCTSTP